MTAENWRPVVGYEGFYEVSDLGRVRSVHRVISRANGTSMTIKTRIRKAHVRKSGHITVGLFRNGIGTTLDVHLLVLAAFIGPRPQDGWEACHNNGNPTDSRLANLRWDTKAENGRDRVRHGEHNNSTKTHCPRGHAYADNAYVTPSRPNARYCKRCARINNRNYLDRKRDNKIGTSS